MMLLFAVLALSPVLTGAITPVAEPLAAQPPAAQPSSAQPALDWLALVDTQRWDDSWKQAGALFHSQVPEANWVSMVAGVRQPLGAVTTRAVQSVEDATTLPGLPVGQYRVIRFATTFANKPGATETVMLTLEPGGWKVDGYFIR